MRKPILLAVSVVAAVAILLVVLFVALNAAGPTSGSASTANVTSTIPVDDTAIAALLPNPGFEDGFTGWTQGYIRTDGSASVETDYNEEVDRSMKHSGAASAHISMPNSGYEHLPTHYGNISIKVPADLFRGKRIRYSAYLRGQDLTGDAGLWMDVPGIIDGKPTDPAFPMIRIDMSHRNILYNEKDWRKAEIVVDIPQEASDLIFGARIGGFGHLWIDDVQLEIVGLDVAVTKYETPLLKITNLDFEQGLDPWNAGSSISVITDTGTNTGTGAEMAHSGKFGAYIRHTGGGADDTGGLWYPLIYGQYYRDKRVTVSAYVNVDKAPKGASLEVVVFYLDAGGNRVSPPITATANALLSLSGTKGWQQIAATVDVPDRATALMFGTMSNGDGEVWIDDVQIDALGPAPTPTQTPR